MSASLSLKITAQPTSTAPARPAAAPDERGQLLRSLLADGQWQCEPPVRERLRVLMQHLLVHAGPCTALGENDWSLMARELECYLDFRRLRHLEARLRGCGDHDFRFTREDWKTARQTEMDLLLHLRRVREASYIPPAADRFRIH
ncbi:MAG TPA: hypothetical protein VLF15_12185 [Pseudoxanthomonas sp.]|nr:hypothetical protein [Pseudoxanthomonas sp.]